MGTTQRVSGAASGRGVCGYHPMASIFFRLALGACQFLSLRQMDQHERWIYNKSKDIADMEKGIAHPHAISPIVSLLMGCVVLSALWEVGSAKTV